MNLKSELEITQHAGGLVGDATRAQWTELLEKMGGGLVRLTVGKLKVRLSKRQISVYEVAKEMKHTLKAAAGAAVELPAAEPAPAVDESDDQDEDGGYPVSEELPTVGSSSSPEAEEHPPTPATTPQPATVKNPRKRPHGVDYAKLLEQHGEMTCVELARVAGVGKNSSHHWLTNHADQVEIVRHIGQSKVYRLKGAPAAVPITGLAVTSLTIKGEPKLSRVTCTSAAVEAPCAGCQRLGVEMAKQLLETDRLTREVERLQPPELRRQLNLLGECLAQVRIALASAEA